jgi:hypothetical protein
MTITGFGQMPIFKRYYLADIPGFAWTANYYLTHRIHYLGAIFLLGFFSFVMTGYFLVGRMQYQLTITTYFRIFFLFGIVLTGIFRVLKNMPQIVFSPRFTFFIDFAHFALVIIFAFSALIFKVLKKGWVMTI